MRPWKSFMATSWTETSFGAASAVAGRPIATTAASVLLAAVGGPAGSGTDASRATQETPRVGTEKGAGCSPGGDDGPLAQHPVPALRVGCVQHSRLPRRHAALLLGEGDQQAAGVLCRH